MTKSKNLLTVSCIYTARNNFAMETEEIVQVHRDIDAVRGQMVVKI